MTSTTVSQVVVFPHASQAWNVTVVNPIGYSKSTAGDICCILSTPLQSVAIGKGKLNKVPHSFTSILNISIDSHSTSGPSESEAITIFDIAVFVPPQLSVTIHVTGIVAPHAFINIDASKSLVTVNSETSSQLSEATTSSNHSVTSSDIS